MNWIKKLLDISVSAIKPWTQNATFFFMMYLLGCVTEWLTLPNTRNAELYDMLYYELFFDVSILCILLWLSGKRIRPILRAFFYFVAYTLAVVDVYCFVTYETTLTPTVMLLMMETNAREAGEFLETVFSADLIFGKVGWVLLILLLHISLNFIKKPFRGIRLNVPIKEKLQPIFGILLITAFVGTGIASIPNKIALNKLMTAGNIGKIEHLLTDKEHGKNYQPSYRFAFSYYANSLTARQIDQLKATIDKVSVDSCSYTSPNIVLIIGESLSKNHSQQYGYWQPTTPRQTWLEKTGRLVKFTDVVTPWNLTSFVFKLMFSTYTVGDKGEWCDYPLFTELFREAGYHVSFLTNQFLPKAKEAVYDFSGGFFLNDPVLSKAQFDTRNTQTHQFDEGLIDDYRQLKPKNAKAQLTIFQLIGQHVVYRQRFPKDRTVFTRDQYKTAKPNLNDRERQTLADYDNSVLYNDSVVTAIVRQFNNKDAIIIYLSDHSEECYEGDLHFFCRMHSTEITSRLAHAEFDIPFWVYCTSKYQKNHPEIYQQIVGARNRKFMTDALPHMLLYLGGIHSKDYREKYNLLSPAYNENRPRILKNTTDYDKLK